MLDVKYHLPTVNGIHSMKPFRVFLEHLTYIENIKFNYNFFGKPLTFACTSELRAPITFLFVNEHIKCGYAIFS